MSLINLTVEKLSSATRIDLYLAGAGIGLSRSQIKRLFGEGRVQVNGRQVRVSFLVSGGEAVSIDRDETQRADFTAESIPLDIVYEDQQIAVINKPWGMVTHPASGNWSGTLANALLHHFRLLSTGYESGYPGLVHRLDKNTSGLMVVAKSDQIHNLLAKQLQQRTLKREYLALVWGRLKPHKGTISIPIGRSRTNRRLMSSGGAKLREAITKYETAEEFDVLSLLQLQLLTGRTHQIRAHLKEIGHPVFGDPEYGGRESLLTGIEARHRQFIKKLLDLTSRQLLHAAKLAFVHPENGQEVEFTAELPEDFGQILEVLRLNR